MVNGKKIREFRLSLGYTTRDVSELSNTIKSDSKISKSYWEEIERGDKKNPSIKKIITIAHVLNCKIDDFVVY